ncbi:MORC family CW-type zinc finger protein 3-like isoform X2 [Physella acuta]|uniref:MORC family CW-type zinc finger protein 3-like isoform X2 n=1 Tax=Physella acuta TaxID=109671 RepID=UPI0027DB7D37|nr:MORC family CW-type zinc finger protein 3-like isoform X2 [Physella acuta]
MAGPRAQDLIHGILPSKVHPNFLQANSTSHTWPFSAIVEIIDNAYDSSAADMRIDKVDLGNEESLMFTDNGKGMDTDHLYRMLSFGYCEKDMEKKKSVLKSVGQYGNGFKSGSMRLGNDALVFTICSQSGSVGFLSQTYLQAINADSVIVPILEYTLPKLKRDDTHLSRNNLRAILQHSVFKTEEQLVFHLNAVHRSITGTRIVISKLKRLEDKTFELDFSSDVSDIRCPEPHKPDASNVNNRPIQTQSSEYKRSLREYCKILYLHPRMKIHLRGVKIKSTNIARMLYQTERDIYKPLWLKKPVTITIGFSCEQDVADDYGLMIYHRNRLIKAYEKVGYQKQPNQLGVGIVGVVEVDFLQPIHNKQDFNKDEKFNSVMSALGQKLNDYWDGKKSEKNETTQPDHLWAQCDNCLKWRRLPPGTTKESLPDNWYCLMNKDGLYNRCDISEEQEEIVTKPTYKKTSRKKKETPKTNDTSVELNGCRKTVQSSTELSKKNTSTGSRRKRVYDDNNKYDEDFERLCKHSTPKKKKDQDNNRKLLRSNEKFPNSAQKSFPSPQKSMIQTKLKFCIDYVVRKHSSDQNRENASQLSCPVDKEIITSDNDSQLSDKSMDSHSCNTDQIINNSSECTTANSNSLNSSECTTVNSISLNTSSASLDTTGLNGVEDSVEDDTLVWTDTDDLNCISLNDACIPEAALPVNNELTSKIENNHAGPHHSRNKSVFDVKPSFACSSPLRNIEAESEESSHSEKMKNQADKLSCDDAQKEIENLKSKLSLTEEQLLTMELHYIDIEERLSNFKSKVHQLLSLMDPVANTGDVSNIDDLVDTMLAMYSAECID